MTTESLITFLQISTDYASALSSQTSGIKSVTSTVITWVSAVMGVISLVNLIIIFTSEGQGETKIRKVGTWVFLLVVCAAGFTITTSLFGS